MSENANETNNGAAEPEKKDVTFSPEQQAKMDEIIKSRLNDANKKHQEAIDALKAKYSSDLEEAEKTAKMKEEEKAKYENEKAMKELEALRKEKQDREHQDEIKSIFSESGINPKIPANLFYHLETPKAKDEIANFKKIFDEAVLEEVNKRIQAHSPKTTAASAANGEKKNPFVRDHARFNFTTVKK